ncbi:phosphoglycerate dehydrogenase [Aestuariibacter salexigens]|uniref:phosphoglycerate dehydrogenase n=1 Tax=Aestuariibacter salexigens TaxID=226010 RepID=UPI0003FDF0AB|nr:phosphoglycerate dehydrogenase [Aestuariibacter salexigens]
MKALITTIPFAEKDGFPLELLKGAGIAYQINPLGRKITEQELADMISDFDILIAGTEPITANVMDNAKNLKLISRVGIGLDNVDLHEARRRRIKVAYTPDAPAPAVAELTIGLLISLLRHVPLSNHQIHSGEWTRHFGKRIADSTIGIIGLGRIGTRVLRRLKCFGTPRILVNDIKPDPELTRLHKIEWVAKETLYKESDLITLHVPLTPLTHNMITKRDLMYMKEDASIINASRGGIINEQDLFDVMKSGHLSGAAIDVFEKEPYVGPLADLPNCLLTAHMGSMSVDCRTRMEQEATEEAVRFVEGKALKHPVPQSEYDVQEAL